MFEQIVSGKPIKWLASYFSIPISFPYKVVQLLIENSQPLYRTCYDYYVQRSRATRKHAKKSDLFFLFLRFFSVCFFFLFISLT